MLDELKFVQGAVAKKEFIPELTHFCIENNTVRSFNGTLALCSPIDLDISCKPKAAPFVKAIQNCKETVSLSMTPAGRLSIKSGGFKAFIECVTEETPHVVPEGEILDLNGDAFIEAVAALETFIGDDASRPWSTGILFEGNSAFATNNVIAAEYWTGLGIAGRYNVPRSAVKELLRIKQAPTHMQVSDKSMTFHFEDGRWIRTALFSFDGWPDLRGLFDSNSGQKATPIPEGFFDALTAIKPFLDSFNRVYFIDGSLCTSIVEGDGASYEVEGLVSEGVFNHTMLERIRPVVKSIDFNAEGRACMFYGDKLRGAITRVRS